MLEDFESDEEEFEEEKCLLCKKSCYSANQLMADQRKRCQAATKISKKMCKHILRDPMVVSIVARCVPSRSSYATPSTLRTT